MSVSIPPVVKKRRLRASDAEVFVGEPAAEGARSSFPMPVDESQRLAALRALNILDTTPEIAYDEIAELAAQICGRGSELSSVELRWPRVGGREDSCCFACSQRQAASAKRRERAESTGTGGSGRQSL